MTQYKENFNVQISHDGICRGSLKIQFRLLRLYFRTGRSSPDNFPFASLVSKPKQICITKSYIKVGKKNSFRDVNVNKTRSKSLRFNFYVVLQPATKSSRSQMFFKRGVLKGFSKFIGKHLYQSLPFNKAVGLKPATLFKKGSGADVFL